MRNSDEILQEYSTRSVCTVCFTNIFQDTLVKIQNTPDYTDVIMNETRQKMISISSRKYQLHQAQSIIFHSNSVVSIKISQVSSIVLGLGLALEHEIESSH